jgi:protein TonB
VPIPDPTPDEPEPIRIVEEIEQEIEVPLDDAVFGIPEGPPASEPEGPIQVGGDVKAPEKTFAPQPTYTEIARKARVQGVVIVQAIIDKQGNVTNIKVLKGLPMGLEEAAVEAMKQWKFKPATLNGKPVTVYYNLTVNFKLQ